MRRSFSSSTLRAAVVLPAVLVVLLATPLPVAAAPEGELACTEYLSWAPTGELAFMPGVEPRIPLHAVSPTVSSSLSLVPHDRLETRK
jgi:hypothetical protein